MNHLTNAVLTAAVASIPETVFDSHSVIRVLLTVYPMEYARELYACVEEDDPIQGLHAEIDDGRGAPLRPGIGARYRCAKRRLAPLFRFCRALVMPRCRCLGSRRRSDRWRRLPLTAFPAPAGTPGTTAERVDHVNK